MMHVVFFQGTRTVIYYLLPCCFLFKLQRLQPSLLHCTPTQIRVVKDRLIGFTYRPSTFVVKAPPMTLTSAARF